MAEETFSGAEGKMQDRILSWLQTDIQLDQDPQVPFCGTAGQHVIPQSVCTSRIAPSHVQNFSLSLIELLIGW